MWQWRWQSQQVGDEEEGGGEGVVEGKLYLHEGGSHAGASCLRVSAGLSSDWLCMHASTQPSGA
jgi:hypothetical protein